MLHSEPVSGNPRDSKWFDTPEGKRERVHIHLTLPREVIAMLTALAKAEAKTNKGVSRSEIVERLIRAEAAKAT